MCNSSRTTDIENDSTSTKFMWFYCFKVLLRLMNVMTQKSIVTFEKISQPMDLIGVVRRVWVILPSTIFLLK